MKKEKSISELIAIIKKRNKPTIEKQLLSYDNRSREIVVEESSAHIVPEIPDYLYLSYLVKVGNSTKKIKSKYNKNIFTPLKQSLKNIEDFFDMNFENVSFSVEKIISSDPSFFIHIEEDTVAVAKDTLVRECESNEPCFTRLIWKSIIAQSKTVQKEVLDEVKLVNNIADLVRSKFTKNSKFVFHVKNKKLPHVRKYLQQKDFLLETPLSYIEFNVNYSKICRAVAKAGSWEVKFVKKDFNFSNVGDYLCNFSGGYFPTDDLLVNYISTDWKQTPRLKRPTMNISVNKVGSEVIFESALEKTTFNTKNLKVTTHRDRRTKEIVLLKEKLKGCGYKSLLKNISHVEKVLKANNATFVCDNVIFASDPYFKFNKKKFAITADFLQPPQQFQKHFNDFDLKPLQEVKNEYFKNWLQTVKHPVLVVDLIKIIKTYDKFLAVTALPKIARGLSNNYSGEQKNFNCYKLFKPATIEAYASMLKNEKFVTIKEKKNEWTWYDVYHTTNEINKVNLSLPEKTKKIISQIDELTKLSNPTIADYGKMISLVNYDNLDVFCKYETKITKFFKNSPKEIVSMLNMMKNLENNESTLSLLRLLIKSAKNSDK